MINKSRLNTGPCRTPLVTQDPSDFLLSVPSCWLSAAMIYFAGFLWLALLILPIDCDVLHWCPRCLASLSLLTDYLPFTLWTWLAGRWQPLPKLLFLTSSLTSLTEFAARRSCRRPVHQMTVRFDERVATHGFTDWVPKPRGKRRGSRPSFNLDSSWFAFSLLFFF